jgi:hypothetical protein
MKMEKFKKNPKISSTKISGLFQNLANGYTDPFLRVHFWSEVFRVKKMYEIQGTTSAGTEMVI